MRDISRRGVFGWFVGGVGTAVLGATIVSVAGPVAAAGPTVPVQAWKGMVAMRWSLLLRHGQDIYDSWFMALHPEGTRDGVLVLSVPVRFLKKWLDAHYLDALLHAAKQADPLVQRVEIVVRPPTLPPTLSIAGGSA